MNVVDKAAQVMRDANGSPEAHEQWKRHPQLVPVNVYAEALAAAGLLRTRPDLLSRTASVLTWIYGYADALTKSDDPRIAKIGDELLRALHEGKS